MGLFRRTGSGPGGAKKPLSREEEVLINQQAATIASSVLPEAVVAAARCEPAEKASSVPKHENIAATTVHVSRKVRAATIYMRNHGLPDSFILAVTAAHVYVLEDRRDDGQLAAGAVLKTWDRSAVLVRVPVDQVAVEHQRRYGLSDDHRVILLWLPVDKDDQPAPTFPAAVHKFIVAQDAPSQRVIDALTAAPKGQFDYAKAATGATEAPSQPSVAQRIQKLESLHATGVISDAEYTAKRERIIGEI
jgi:hypothetical protein